MKSPSSSLLNGEIRRIRGIAPALVWPQEIAGRILRRVLGFDEPSTVSAAEPDWVACAREFAAANEWKYLYPWSRDSQRELCDAVDQLERDLVVRGDRAQRVVIDCFDKDDRFGAFVVHCAGELALESVPPDVVVDRLPASWHHPRWTAAYVLRAPSPAERASDSFENDRTAAAALTAA